MDSSNPGSITAGQLSVGVGEFDLRDGRIEEMGQRCPAVGEVVDQQPLWGDHPLHMLVVPLKVLLADPHNWDSSDALT